MKIVDLLSVIKAGIYHPKITFDQLGEMCAKLRSALTNPCMPLLMRARIINLLDQAQRRRRELGNAAAF